MNPRNGESISEINATALAIGSASFLRQTGLSEIGDLGVDD